MTAMETDTKLELTFVGGTKKDFFCRFAFSFPSLPVCDDVHEIAKVLETLNFKLPGTKSRRVCFLGFDFFFLVFFPCCLTCVRLQAIMKITSTGIRFSVEELANFQANCEKFRRAVFFLCCFEPHSRPTGCFCVSLVFFCFCLLHVCLLHLMAVLSPCLVLFAGFLMKALFRVYSLKQDVLYLSITIDTLLNVLVRAFGCLVLTAARAHRTFSAAAAAARSTKTPRSAWPTTPTCRSI